MFTGIVEAVGRIAAVEMTQGDMRLRVQAGTLDLSDVKLGDSIATNGVCLTVTGLTGDGFWADVSRETLAHTRFGTLSVGEAVNLEKAMMPTSRFGGHIVTGHVDGIGEVVERRDDARSIRLRVRAPSALARYIAGKGSVTVDGVSLTVNAVDGAEFELNIVPHTAAETVIAGYGAGSPVHLEVDIVARYLERLLQFGSQSPAGEAADDGGLTLAKLNEYGFSRR
ncbi:riboflavin synthase subunit alpha [Marinobacterium nitratireducens]|uniref:Riboflavin synthase n=1 Tax=Marinobacterium nitratireducens TaxID=518897 RepID=A0A918DQB6_9GAMM|nr:riboflavin synthase [Marinobacterium nitratireducens]GGO78380.1 riboflavin synthase subunit alpha [Marinobacterium nitratireducens]